MLLAMLKIFFSSVTCNRLNVFFFKAFIRHTYFYIQVGKLSGKILNVCIVFASITVTIKVSLKTSVKEMIITAQETFGLLVI